MGRLRKVRYKDITRKRQRETVEERQRQREKESKRKRVGLPLTNTHTFHLALDFGFTTHLSILDMISSSRRIVVDCLTRGSASGRIEVFASVQARI